MISKIGFFYDSQIVEKQQPPAVIDGLKGRNKYIDFGKNGYRQVQTAEEVGFLGTAFHWLTTMSGIKPVYKVTEYYGTEQGAKLDRVWSRLKDDLAPKATAERIEPELSLEDCEFIQEGHPIHPLPAELLCHIFSYCDLTDTSRISQTCKIWKRIAATENAGLVNYHLNPVRITLEGHKAGTYRGCEYTQAEGSTKVVKTLDLIQEEDLQGKNFGVFVDPWNQKPGIAVRFISRSLNNEGDLIESRAVLVALKKKEGVWTAKSISASPFLYKKTKRTDKGYHFVDHDPAKLFIYGYKESSQYLKQLVTGKPCGGMIRECNTLGVELLLQEGPAELSEKATIQISKNDHVTSEESTPAFRSSLLGLS